MKEWSAWSWLELPLGELKAGRYHVELYQPNGCTDCDVMGLKPTPMKNVRCITASGGVTCNRALRQGLVSACERESLRLRLAAPALCTDNAAMIGILAECALTKGRRTELDADLLPGWPLER